MCSPAQTTVAQLLHSLAFDIHNQPTNVQTEVNLCGKFIDLYTEESANELSEKGIPAKLIESITRNRLCNLSWTASRPPRKWFHPILRITRVLLRTKTNVEKFHEIGEQSNFVQFSDYVIKQLIVHESSQDYVQSVATILNILQKLCSTKEYVERFVVCRLYKTQLQLLTSTDMGVLQGSLEVLGRLADWSNICRLELCASNVIDVCLQLAPQSDLLTQKLCVSLLRILSCEEQAREQIKIYDGVPLLVGLLSVKNSRLQWHVAWSLAQLAEDTETSNEIAQLGGVSLLLAEMQTKKIPERGVGDWIAMMTGLCALLAQLCQLDSNQILIVNLNGIYTLGGVVMMIHTAPHLSESNNFKTLQCAVFRVLRLLFSLERNRHFFKKVFHADFFASFIDVGHYVHELSAYAILVENYKTVISFRGFEEIKADWESVNMRKDPMGVVGEYELLEQLGAGAFGCVYTVRKRTKDHMASPHYYALKEIYMVQTDGDSDKSFGDIISEVKIIKQQLRHPNIVRYRRIFVENHRLYIVMDLIEGASLKEHINSTKEKREQFKEDRVWNIVIQLILALRYLHKEKRIVHRDLKPNNIMLTDSDRVVVTDFGLAKERGADYLKSAAGTIIYSCPEVVQHFPYGEKADIWSFGCCVYEVCNLHPAFHSQNMLQLATMIVEGRYKAVVETYSDLLRSLISECLSTHPSSRPDIEGVARLVAPKLLLCLDDVFRIHASNASSGEFPKFIIGGEERPSSVKRETSSLTSSGSSSFGVLSRLHKRRQSMSAENPVNGNKEKITLLPSIDNNIDKPRKSSAKSLSAGARSNRGNVPVSCSLPKISQNGGTIKDRRLTLATVSGHKRASSSGAVDKSDGLVTVRSDALRPISDPVLQILLLIQNMHQISHFSPDGAAMNHKKRVVEQFQKRIFDRIMLPDKTKHHLRKLVTESPDHILLDLGYADFRPVLTDLPLPGFQVDKKITRLTYEQLAQCIQTLKGQIEK